MSRNPCYFWKNGEVLIHDPEVHGSIDERYDLCECVDTYYEQDNPFKRYGYFVPQGWEAKSFSDFPPEFKAHLLLLGVS